MDRVKRVERLGVIARILTDSPNRIYNLSHFCDLLGAVKSSISEDIDLLAQSFARFGLGEISTVAGAAGGVRYRPIFPPEQLAVALSGIAQKLSQPGRLLPGDLLYTADVMSDPGAVGLMGQALAGPHFAAKPDFVLTMETKGIPVAMTTARALDVPLVIARRDSKAYEGSAVKINYISGTGGNLSTMSLARRAVESGKKALIIDDFAKGGGTLRGMCDLMAEFSIEVVGIGVVIATAQPAQKSVGGVQSLLTLREVDRAGERAVVVPSDWALGAK